ncbi:unnamed protein product [Dovyalis caffra]|uniref:Uncharacterized protein n=1 Tax=Dovyalis caffra TaxID=77055 RepID=A0AAV1QUX9_9ROSI|nr:unnamed protein product [Dovyalis caffra]
MTLLAVGNFLDPLFSDRCVAGKRDLLNYSTALVSNLGEGLFASVRYAAVHLSSYRHSNIHGYVLENNAPSVSDVCGDIQGVVEKYMSKDKWGLKEWVIANCGIVTNNSARVVLNMKTCLLGALLTAGLKPGARRRGAMKIEIFAHDAMAIPSNMMGLMIGNACKQGGFLHSPECLEDLMDNLGGEMSEVCLGLVTSLTASWIWEFLGPIAFKYFLYGKSQDIWEGSSAPSML